MTRVSPRGYSTPAAMKRAPRAAGAGAPVRVGLLAFTAALSLACEAIPERHFTGHVASSGGFAVVERRDGQVAMLAPDLTVKWVYKPRFPPPPPAVGYQDAHLVCRPGFEREGPVVLTYTREAHAVARDTGARVWRIGRPQGSGRHIPQSASCPAVAPDSGVVVLEDEGLLLRKHDASGAIAWEFELAPFGGAIAAPHVVWPDGAIVLRTRAHVVVFSPAGQVVRVLPWR